MASDAREWLGRLAFGGLWLFGAVACLSIAAQNVIFLGLAAWFALLLWERRWPSFPPSLLLWTVFLLVALLASILSDNSAHSIFTWRKWLLAYLIIYVADALREPRALRSVMGSLLFFSALTCLGASLFALYGPWSSGLNVSQILAQWAERGEWRAVSGSGGYMVLGSCSMLILVFFGALYLKDPQWRRPVVLLCLAVVAMALLLTQTRSAWFGAMVGGALILWSWRKSALLLLALLFGLSVWLLPNNPLAQRLKQGLDMSQDSTRERVFMAETGLAIIKDHPWLGVGDSLESFDGHPGYYLRYMVDDAKQYLSLKDRDEGHLHNDFIQVAVMYGLPGLLLLLAFFVLLGSQAFDSGSTIGLAMAASLLAWFVNGGLEYNLGSFQSSFVLWFLIGLYFAGASHDARTAH